jgi:apolipoprotein N-acyltransferase
MVPLAVFGLPALLAAFSAGVALLLHITRIRGIAQILLLAVLWTAMEWMRGHVLTGFPWNLIGYVWTASNSVRQLAALTGIWGLSFLTILVAAMPAILGHTKMSIPMRWCAVASAPALLGGVWTAGAVRLHPRWPITTKARIDRDVAATAADRMMTPGRRSSDAITSA